MSQKLPYLEVETVTPQFRDTGFLTSLCVKWHFKQQLCSLVQARPCKTWQILHIFLKSFRFIISCHLLSLKQFHLLKTTSFYMSKNASILIKVTICDRRTKCLFQECCSLWKRVCLKEKLFLGSVYLPRWRDLFFQWRLSLSGKREWAPSEEAKWLFRKSGHLWRESVVKGLKVFVLWGVMKKTCR